MKTCFSLLHQVKQDFLAVQEKMVQTERKVNEVRAEVFQFITCLPPAALMFVSTTHSSCSESTIKVKKPFSRSNRGCTQMLTIQEEFATSNYPAASDVL